MKTDARPPTKTTLSTPASGNGHVAETKAPLPNHPLASVIGVFKDDPEFDALMEQIHEARRQQNVEEALETV